MLFDVLLSVVLVGGFGFWSADRDMKGKKATYFFLLIMVVVPFPMTIINSWWGLPLGIFSFVFGGFIHAVKNDKI